jgi:ATP-binding cassette subfamily C (CFTR/MRP) protein 2
MTIRKDHKRKILKFRCVYRINFPSITRSKISYTFMRRDPLTLGVSLLMQNSWMAARVDDPQVSTSKLVVVYLLIGVLSNVFMIIRSLLSSLLGFQSSKQIFSQLMNSLFRAPMSFYDSTPLGKILSRVSILNTFSQIL